jgi:hypothetical protein
VKSINCNVSGTPTDVPVIMTDTPAVFAGVFEGTPPNRCVFRLPDDATGGGHLRWDLGRRNIDFLIPPAGTVTEGADLGLTIAYGPVVPPGRLTTAGDQFLLNGQRWVWRGATDFRFLEHFRAGRDLDPLVTQRTDAGVNLFRVVAQKANNTGWELRPDYSNELLRDFFRWLLVARTYVEFTVFADTRTMMPDQGQQLAFWRRVVDVAGEFPHVLLELVNEAGHGTQRLDPQAFPRPTNGVLASHGSGLTDGDVVRPTWDFATYHARRDPPPDGRGFTAYDAYEFQADYPKPCPFIPDEGIKPEGYGFDTHWAGLMGRHANVGAGGTFHTAEGVNSVLWDDRTVACAQAFFRELGS